MGQFLRGQSIYLVHVLSLLAPGKKVPSFSADPLKPEDVSAWEPEELKLLIEEGRRQADRQQADFHNLRGRAQWLFTVGVAALGALGVGLARATPDTPVAIAWVLGLLGLVYGVGGAAAILVARADFKSIHAALVSALSKPVDRSLAQVYARMMADGENTIATRLTVFRQAVVWCLSGGYLGLIAVLLDR